MRCRSLIVCIFVVMVAGQMGCNVVDQDEKIPSYLHIDSMTVQLPEDSDKKSVSHDIVDVWVRAGNDFIGVFELPATIPVLKTGEQSITLRAGIKNNGISNTRGQYPFYLPVDTTLSLEAKETDSLGTVKTEYAKNLDYLWEESFEDSDDLTIKNSNEANVQYQITRQSSEVFEGNASMKVEFKDQSQKQLFEIQKSKAVSSKDLSLTASTYLEIDFKTNIEVKMGLIAIPPAASDIAARKRSKLILNETDDWQKIYINLKSNLQDYPPDYNFRFFFGAVKDNDGPATFYLDNVKLIHG